VVQDEICTRTILDFVDFISGLRNPGALVQMEKQLHTTRTEKASVFMTETGSGAQTTCSACDTPVAEATRACDSAEVLRAYKIGRKSNQFPLTVSALDPVGDPEGARCKTSNRGDFGKRDPVIRQNLMENVGGACERSLRVLCTGRINGKNMCSTLELVTMCRRCGPMFSIPYSCGHCSTSQCARM
jgi:hypothetical protein